MSDRRIVRCLMILGVTTQLACASAHAPKQWLPSTSEVPEAVYGAWVYVEVRTADGQKTYHTGELIAVTADSVFFAGPRLRAIAWQDVHRAKVARYENGGGMAGVVVVGSLSTISNGYGMILTLPMWLIGGSVAASHHASAPYQSYPHDSVEKIAPFARYPRGLPEGIDRARIRSKPFWDADPAE